MRSSPRTASSAGNFETPAPHPPDGRSTEAPGRSLLRDVDVLQGEPRRVRPLHEYPDAVPHDEGASRYRPEGETASVVPVRQVDPNHVLSFPAVHDRGWNRFPFACLEEKDAVAGTAVQRAGAFP